MKNKRGQFYLIVTIIIVTIIISFAAISNYVSQRTSTSIRLNDMAGELRIEGERVLDYDRVQGTNQFDNFARDYSEYVGNEIDIYFIVGEKSSIEAFNYEGGTRVNFTDNLSVSSNIVFMLDEINYEFKLEEGVNFYFIIFQDFDGEKYVFSG